MADKNQSKIRYDDFVSKVQADPANPQATIMLAGFAGRGPEGHVRIYPDPALVNWYDVPEADVVHSQPIADSALGGSPGAAAGNGCRGCAAAYAAGADRGNSLRRVWAAYAASRLHPSVSADAADPLLHLSAAAHAALHDSPAMPHYASSAMPHYAARALHAGLSSAADAFATLSDGSDPVRPSSDLRRGLHAGRVSDAAPGGLHAFQLSDEPRDLQPEHAADHMPSRVHAAGRVRPAPHHAAAHDPAIHATDGAGGRAAGSTAGARRTGGGAGRLHPAHLPDAERRAALRAATHYSADGVRIGMRRPPDEPSANALPLPHAAQFLRDAPVHSGLHSRLRAPHDSPANALPLHHAGSYLRDAPRDRQYRVPADGEYPVPYDHVRRLHTAIDRMHAQFDARSKWCVHPVWQVIRPAGDETEGGPAGPPFFGSVGGSNRCGPSTAFGWIGAKPPQAY